MIVLRSMRTTRYSGRQLAMTIKLLALLAWVSISAAQNFSSSTTPDVIRVDWGFDLKEPLNASVGDIIEFSWSVSGYHDVFIHPSGDCDNKTGAIGIYPLATTGGAVNYTFTASDAAPEGGTVFFVCQVGQGVHCRYNVHQLVTVYPLANSMVPTAAPSPTVLVPSTNLPSPSVAPTAAAVLPTAPPTISPTSLPTSLPTSIPTSIPSLETATATATFSPSSEQLTTNEPTTMANETATPSAFPTDSLSGSASEIPSTVTGMETESPSGVPAFQTPFPSPSPTMAPSFPPILAGTAAPSGLPSDVPSSTPSISRSPTSTPTTTPSVSPSIATPSPTTVLMTNTLNDLEITLFGTTELSDEDIADWESVTSLYQTTFYADGKNGVVEFQTQLDVVSASRRRLQQGDSVTVIYNQNMTYRLANVEMTPAEIVTTPFSTEEDRNQYVTIYLNNVGDNSALSNVTETSSITGDIDDTGEVLDSTDSAPDESNKEEIKKENDGLSTGVIIGIAVGALVGCVLCCLMTAQRRPVEEDEWEEEEENPYVPPSPAAFDNYSATDKSVEHAFYKD